MRRMILVLVAMLAGCGGAEKQGDDAQFVVSAPAASECPCRALDQEACYARVNCEAIPFLGHTDSIVEVDERNFLMNPDGTLFTDLHWIGCRPLGTECRSLEEVLRHCPRGPNGIDAQGCPTCEEGDEKPACGDVSPAGL